MAEWRAHVLWCTCVRGEFMGVSSVLHIVSSGDGTT